MLPKTTTTSCKECRGHGMNKYAGNDQETPCHCCGGSGQVTSPLHDKTPNASPAHNPMDKVASSAHEPPAS